jgi:hypothetical protein
MSIIKNVSGPYTINTINHDDPIILDSNVVIIKGNLQVVGNTTTITTENTGIKDNIIVLNQGEAGAGITLGTAGILIDRGSSPNVTLRYAESTGKWQATNDGTTYYNIVATTTGNTRLVDDAAPTLGANLNTNGFTILNLTSANVGIAAADAIQFDAFSFRMKTIISPTPTVIPNYNVIVASNVGTGGTGFYVSNTEGTTQEELISKSRAVVYSIIF